MTTLQNPNPTQSSRPHAYPNLSPVQNPNIAPSSSSSLTFDEVSKFFSLPLSDAADSLGVCPSVLKKICYDNGLIRWPYRKLLAGKSVEEIKEDAAREKRKHLNELPKAAEQVNDASASLTIPSPLGSPLQNKTCSVQELAKSQIVMQPQGNKNAPTGSPLKLHGSTLTKGAPSNSDEFKYGFPSDGLSSLSYGWWGDSNNGSMSIEGNANEEIQENRICPTSLVDSGVLSSTKDGDKCEKKLDKSDVDSVRTGSLTALRKKAVKEGQEALKLGVHRKHGINKLDQTKKMVLLQIFKSSLPSEWRDGSF